MNILKEQAIPLKKILEAAVMELGVGSYDEYYMCSAIKKASMLFDCDGSQAIKKAAEIGFTKENYWQFVLTNFPELHIYEISDAKSWISVMKAVVDQKLADVIRSKRKFLHYLADNL